ncbi:hypothetical protein PVAG01_02138 [Phlyctema vagabunda]|uniref:Rhodopsin n=1 Tax=Phlyctema vagabunda TaxID=108571 RepID=A0ABR4PQF0_9HELO
MDVGLDDGQRKRVLLYLLFVQMRASLSSFYPLVASLKDPGTATHISVSYFLLLFYSSSSSYSDSLARLTSFAFFFSAVCFAHRKHRITSNHTASYRIPSSRNPLYISRGYRGLRKVSPAEHLNPGRTTTEAPQITTTMSGYPQQQYPPQQGYGPPPGQYPPQGYPPQQMQYQGPPQGGYPPQKEEKSHGCFYTW